METLWQDLRYGARMLARSPGFTTVAVLSLALGIGANTAIFSVLHAVVLQPFPYHEPDRIVTLWQTHRKEGGRRDQVSVANFLDWQERSQSFEAMAILRPYGLDYTGGDYPESIRSWLVSRGFFQILGVDALIGRTLVPEDYKPGNDNVAVFSHGLWQRKFGAAPDVVGQRIVLDGEPFTVVGVMPPEFAFPDKHEIWAPFIVTEATRQTVHGAFLDAVARLKPGVTLAQAQAEMDAIAAQLRHEHPRRNEDVGVAVVPLPEQVIGHVRPALLLLLGAVGLVLLIACANVANLLVARSAQREQEFAVRTALGATRMRLMRQLLTESFLLAFLGGAGGLLLASWAASAIVSWGPSDLPRLDQVGLNPTVLGFGVAVSSLTAIVFGLIPALRLSPAEPFGSLKEGSRTAVGGRRQHRLRHVLVVGEVMVALVLLAGAGLLVRSFVRLMQVDLGFLPQRVLALQVFVFGGKYPDDRHRMQFFDDVLQRLASLPGVNSAGAASFLPFVDAQIEIKARFAVEGQPAPEPGQEPLANVTIATPGYFRTMGIPLRRGRLFGELDNLDSAPVVLINETLARRYWPDEDPIGRRIALSHGGVQTREIIGVVGDVRQYGLLGQPVSEVFLPLRQAPFGSMTLLVRSAGDPLDLLAATKTAVWAVDKDLPFWSSAPMTHLIADSVADRRGLLLLLGLFAAMALCLAVVGIYGVISLLTAQRTREIGVRLALGAQRRDVLWLVLGQGMKLTFAGVALGLIGAVLSTRLLSSFLYGVKPTDPLTLAVVAALLTVVALLACYVPARRATRVDPMTALRYE